MTVRKSSSQLTPDEQQGYVNAVNKLNSGSGTTQYAAFVAIHADMSHRMHTTMGAAAAERFLPWHRDFLLKFEAALQAAAAPDPVFIPYWEWSVDRQVTPWLANLLPTVKVPAVGGMPGMAGMGGQKGRTIKVTRTPSLPNGLPHAQQVESLDEDTSLSFDRFLKALDLMHGTIHNWVGGTMMDIHYSPADPLFWTHHAEVDRIWARWQSQPHNAGKKPKLTGADLVMDPWTETLAKLTSIQTLGYSYA